MNTQELTSEEFIREKIREKNQFPATYKMEALSQYTINGEEALRWAHEFATIKGKQLIEQTCDMTIQKLTNIK